MKNIQLYDYQQDMKQRIEETFQSHQSVMVQMPTGTGKTHLLAAVVSGYIAQNHGRVWIVAHRRELVRQISDTIALYIPQENLNRVLVLSIQWLIRHYGEMQKSPVLIVIDEAHHALAKTYATVMSAFPRAKKLGVTATPCRLNGKGFTDLFEVLLTSWSMDHFMAVGRLSLYDYYSIQPDSEEQLKIDALKKRGTDGDYQLKEMDGVLNQRPSIERLCRTVLRYARSKKGIVYAINIDHAEHIAAYYRAQGIRAVALSSRTPVDRRDEAIRKFKFSGTRDIPPEIDVLVSVDLFSEGFDCPDVEFIQLARPTLSLAKYLQMVGRGLRVAKGKEYCIILDNVGLYKRFGLPSADWDWQQMFSGQLAEADWASEVSQHISYGLGLAQAAKSGEDDMVQIFDHLCQQKWVESRSGFRMFSNGTGQLGVMDINDIQIVPCRYKHIELTEDGFAFCYNFRPGRKPWTDLKNGLWFRRRPRCMRLGNIEFSGEDENRLYPRIRSRWIDESARLNLKTLELQVGCGVSWKQLFIPWKGQEQIYQLVESHNSGVRIYRDEKNRMYAQKNLDIPPVKVGDVDKLRICCQKWEDMQKEIDHNLMEFRKKRSISVSEIVRIRDGLVKDCTVQYNQDRILDIKTKNREEYWIDTLTNTKHLQRPVLRKRGYVELLIEGEMTFVRNIREVAGIPLPNWCIKADAQICTIYNRLYLKCQPYTSFEIRRRSDDFSYFIVKTNFYGKRGYYFLDMKITQYPGEELKCTYVKTREDMISHGEIKEYGKN